MIDLSTLPYGIIDRTTAEGKSELYEELDLYSYSTKGTEYDPTNPQADTSQPLGKKVSRVRKNYPILYNSTVTPEILVSSFSSSRFIVSPTDVYNDGDTQNNLASDILKDTEGNPGANSITMTWAEANGRLNTANSQNWDIPSQATNTGCYAYRGKSGKDEPDTAEMYREVYFHHDELCEKFMEKTGIVVTGFDEENIDRWFEVIEERTAILKQGDYEDAKEELMEIAAFLGNQLVKYLFFKSFLD